MDGENRSDVAGTVKNADIARVVLPPLASTVN